MARAVAMVTGAVTVSYALDRLGATEYGIFGIVGSVMGLLGLIDMGLYGAVLRFTSQDQASGDRQRLRATYSTALVTLSALGAAGAVLMIAVTPWVKTFFAIEERYYQGLIGLNICLAVSFALNFVCITNLSVLAGGNRYDLLNAVEIVASLVRLGLLVLFFECLGVSLPLFGLTYVLSQVIRLTGFASLSRWSVARERLFSLSAVSPAALRRLAGFSVINAVAMVGWLLMLQGPNLLIGRMLGPAMVAAFAAPLLVGSSLRALIMGLTSPLIPLAGREAAEGRQANLGEWSVRLSRLSCILGLAIVLPLSIFARPILHHWIGSGYVWTAPVFIVMIVAQLVVSVQLTNYYLVLGGGNIVPWAAGQIAACIAAFAVAIAGHALWGWELLGIVSSFAIADVVRCGLHFPLVCCRSCGVRVARYYWQAYGRPLIPAVAAGAVSLALIGWRPPDSVRLLAWQGLLNVLLFGMGVYFVALDAGDRDLLHGYVQSAVRRAREAMG